MKNRISDILTVLAIVAVLTLCVVIYQKPVSYDVLRCYDPKIKNGLTYGLYVDATDCVYDEDEGIWECNEGEYNYCLN